MRPQPSQPQSGEGVEGQEVALGVVLQGRGSGGGDRRGGGGFSSSGSSLT